MNPAAKEPEPRRGPNVRVKPFWLLFRRLEKVTRRKGGTLTTAHTNNGYAPDRKHATPVNHHSLRFLYAPRPPSLSFLYTPTADNCPTRQSPYDGEFFMSVLDGVSLLLAAGLFVYLLVALLRAGRVEE